jgi:hypothetical protein
MKPMINRASSTRHGNVKILDNLFEGVHITETVIILDNFSKSLTLEQNFTNGIPVSYKSLQLQSSHFLKQISVFSQKNKNQFRTQINDGLKLIHLNET